MTEPNPQQGTSKHRLDSGSRSTSLWKQGTRAVQRYLLLATGISSTALGLALLVSVFAATQSPPAAADSVKVSQIEGRYTASSLDSTLLVISPRLESFDEEPLSAKPAPPLDVEKPAPPTPFELLQITIPAASPPAAGLDPTPTPEPLDAAAAALPVPILAQVEAAEAPEEAPITPPNGLPTIGQIPGVNVTFYDCLEQGFCGAMYNGEQVYEGAAACSWNLPLGTRFVIENDPTQRVYICLDRGLLADTWVDIFFYDPDDGWLWQQVVGRYSTIHILSIPSF